MRCQTNHKRGQNSKLGDLTSESEIEFVLSRQGFDSHILRFSARLLIDGKADAKRKFVVSYFLSDDTILVTLVPELNSGKMAIIA